MKVLMFWSYKGGSGRTVAAANAAAALAKLGKRVAIIDLDFEGPGLHHVFGVEETEQYKNGTGIQHFLKGDIEVDRIDTEVMINLFGAGGPLRRYQGEVPQGVLWYIMASPKVTQVNAAQNPQVVARLRSLLQLLREKHEIEYVIIDAASGLREAYSIAADVSHEMMAFFRFSVQHVQGTLHMIKYMGLFKEFEQHYIPFRVIASAVPGDLELDQVEDVRVRQQLARTKEEARSDIMKLLKRYDMTPSEVFYEIPEMVQMKWREALVVFGEGVSEYQKMIEKYLQSQVES
jgi:MinD-like ATPase involved in chromosome partitioning or flagellar assembly